jgi:hypothetical protein
MNDRLTRFEPPQIKTTARPNKTLLLAARHEVQRTAAVREVFRLAQEGKWSAAVLEDRLFIVLQNRLEGTSEEIGEVARYLADEHEQLGGGLMMISRETGQAIALLTEEDLWQPPPVERESGNVITPARRIRPDLEGALVHWEFTREREKQLLATATQRLHQTELQRQEGDPRLLPLTRKGRTTIVEAIEGHLPALLLNCQQPVLRRFLDLFRMAEVPLADTDAVRQVVDGALDPLLPCVGVAQSILPIPDPATFNLRYDHISTLLARTASQWGREIARGLAVEASLRNIPREVPLDEVSREPLQGVCIAEPDVVAALQQVDGALCVLPVSGAPTTCIQAQAGVILIDPASYVCRGREFHDRWEVVARFEYAVWIDWGKVASLRISGVRQSGIAVEVL